MRVVSHNQFLVRIFFDGDRESGRKLEVELPERVAAAGFGPTVHLHDTRGTAILETIVDSDDSVERLLGVLDEVLHEGHVTVERAHVVRYVPG
jgi:hypothetical protein